MNILRPRAIILFIGAMTIIVIGILARGTAVESLPPGVSRKDYDQLGARLHQALRRNPPRDEVLFQLGNQYAERQDWKSASAAFAAVAWHSSHGREARYLQAQSALQQDRLRESEQFFKQYLQAPDDSNCWASEPDRDERIQALHYLSYLFAIELRHDDRRGLLHDMIRQGDADLFDTLACHFQSLMEWNNTHAAERLERACATTPEDWQLQAALAQYRIAQGRLEDATTLLENCRSHMPHDRAIQSAALTCYEERGDWNQYVTLGKELPTSSASDSVQLLRHRAQIAVRLQQPSVATGFYNTALQRDPANAACRLGMAQACQLLGEIDQRKRELEIAQYLARIQNKLGWASSPGSNPDALLEIAQLSAKAGLVDATTDICQASLRSFRQNDQFEQLLKNLPQTTVGEKR